MMNKKYIFFDIDGTLLDSNGQVSQSTKEAILKVRQNGHKVFINTGRARKLVPKILIEVGFDGFICGTGTVIEYNNNIIFEKYFSEKQANKVINYFIKYNIPFLVSAMNECAVSCDDLSLFIEVFSQGKIKASNIGDLNDVNNPFFESIKPVIVDNNKKDYFYNHINITDFVYINSKLSVTKINNDLGKDIHAEKASFKKPDERSGEITLANYNKATGIKYVINYFNVDINDTVCFGDGFNDLEMLNCTPLSIAMGNAPDEVKKQCIYVTDNIENDGVYKALKHFKLI